MMGVRPDLSRLFTSNSIPTPDETKEIRQGIQNLNSKIAELHSQLRALEDDLRRHWSTLSPVRMLPLEVIGNIFVLALPDILDDVGRASLINLSLVCKTWYEAARATLQLWSGIELKRYETNHDRIVAWYNRSGRSKENIPKSLKWVITRWHRCDEGTFAQCESNNPTLIKLLTDGPELHHLTIEVPSTQCFRHIFTSLLDMKPKAEVPWSSLRSLTLGIGSDWTEFRNSLSIGISPFLHLPSTVTEFKLYLPPRATLVGDDWQPLPELTVPIPPSFYQQLTAFTIRCDWSMDHLLKIIKHCTAVVDLTIDMGICRVAAHAHQIAANLYPKLPHVQILRMRHVHPQHLFLLWFTHAPSLLHFDIDFAREEPGAQRHILGVRSLSTEGFWKHFMMQHTALQSIRISHVDINSLVLSGLFISQLPSLTRLTLDDVQFDGSLFKHLMETPGFGGGKLWFPALERLELLNLPTDFDHTYLFEFVKANRPWPKAEGANEAAFEAPPDGLSLVLTYQKQKMVPILEPFTEDLKILKEARGVNVKYDTRYKVVINED